ncbi:MAG TPA: dTMP kinase [Candidatus Gastranaerophilales bacterium]|nr:dTMP kinase [Candidatus Gastranaerophilales bacterium]
MRLSKSHDLPGTLIVVEGVDGSGKSTQISLLRDWLISTVQDVIYTEWNSSRIISDTTKKAKKKNLLTPRTFSLLHAVDFADRLEQIIVPALKAGFVVLADRYVYTAFARDVSRGVDREWVRNMYGFSICPDLALYFHVPIETSLARICANRAPKFYEAGMDLNLSKDPHESYNIFQGRVINEYDKMIDEYGLVKIDGTETVHNQQVILRNIVSKMLEQKNIRVR